MAPVLDPTLRGDRKYLIHPLHHPVDVTDPIIYVIGHGSKVQDVEGNEYIDGPSGLWNVNVGHGQIEMADAAVAQMNELASKAMSARRTFP